MEVKMLVIRSLVKLNVVRTTAWLTFWRKSRSSSCDVIDTDPNGKEEYIMRDSSASVISNAAINDIEANLFDTSLKH
uniref:Uncharacterized protein n=1 Tax=Ignisphaera aggregans TaxID=334771 RepID=A0A7J2TAH7_9CREN